MVLQGEGQISDSADVLTLKVQVWALSVMLWGEHGIAQICISFISPALF